MSLLFVTCSKEETKKILSKDKTITKVALNISPKVTATVDGTKITASVPFGTDLTKVTLAISHSGASIAPDPKIAQDFSAGKSVTYTVKAKDGTTQDYTVSISVAEKQNSDKTITKASIISPLTEMSIDGTTITATVPFGTNLTAIILNIEHSGASIAPLLSEVQDFSGGKSVTYTVTAEDGTTQDYTVSISILIKAKIEITDVHIGFHSYYGQVTVAGKDLKNVVIVISTQDTPKELSLISTEARLIRDFKNNVSRPIAITWDDTFKNEYLYELTNTSKKRDEVSIIKTNDNYTSKRIDWLLKENTIYYIHAYYDGKTITHSFNTKTYPSTKAEAKTKYNWEAYKNYNEDSFPKKIEYSKANPLIVTGEVFGDGEDILMTLRLWGASNTVKGGCRLKSGCGSTGQLYVRLQNNKALYGSTGNTGAIEILGLIVVFQENIAVSNFQLKFEATNKGTGVTESSPKTYNYTIVTK